MTSVHTTTAEGPKVVVAVLKEMLECGVKPAKSAKVDSKEDNNSSPLPFDVFETIEKFGIHHINSRDNSGWTLLHFATDEGHKEVVELLLNSGAKVDSENNNGLTPLHLSAKRGYQEIIRTILKFGADIDSEDINDKTALHYATEEGHKEVVELLLDYGAEVDAKDELHMTPLHWGAEKGFQEIIMILLKFGADINSRDSMGQTALHWATINGHKEVFELLVDRGAEVDSRDGLDYTSLHVGANEGHPECIKTILKLGADINSREFCHRTPLHIATMSCNKEVVDLLLDYGATVDFKDDDGMTPLHWCGTRPITTTSLTAGQAEIVASLLKYGSDVNLTSNKGWTPFNYANNACDGFYDDSDGGLNLCQVTTKVFISHIVKMKTANLYISEQNLQSINKSKFRDFYYECEEEISRMMSEKINNNANVTYYDILSKSISSLAIYLRNEDIVQVLKSDHYITMFPIYANEICSNIKRGIEKKELLEQSTKVLHKIFLVHFDKFPELHEVSQKIISYLRDEDLRILINPHQ